MKQAAMILLHPVILHVAATSNNANPCRHQQEGFNSLQRHNPPLPRLNRQLLLGRDPYSSEVGELPFLSAPPN